MKKQALISVSDKTGAVDFARELSALGYTILSTGGTAKAISDAGVAVTEVSDLTGFPECLDGRVKTLHPRIHAGILARRGDSEHMRQLSELDVATIDIVAINLYPFRAAVSRPDVTLETAIENIDIGGPAMLRSAAKNWQDVCVLTDPGDYSKLISLLKAGEVPESQKFEWCRKVFEHTASYDSTISRWLGKYAGEEYPDTLSLTFDKAQMLRYGENPHQTAAFYRDTRTTGATLADAVQLHGKELSFNNINDASSALMQLREFDGTPCAVVVKHANACGVGVGESIFEAYMNAYNADPMSIYGGIVAVNECVDEKTALEMGKIFLEVIIAPDYSEAALEILGKKKNIRLLKIAQMMNPTGADYDIKKVSGGLLLQSPDTLQGEQMKAVTKRAPSESEIEALKFAWKVVKHTRSNAIVLSTASQTVGVGPGQTNRIGALEIAIRTGVQDKIAGSVMASDAVFPFTDCVELAAKAGITAIIQPGGGKADQDCIDACDEHGIAMVFTGARHFRH